MAQYRTDTQKLDQPTVTRYEVMMLSDRITTSGTATDGFGRLRVGTPFTLFESQHRYKDNEKFDTATTGATANAQYKINESVIDMNVGTAQGDKVIRESKRVFSYQPGKSLLILNTFALSPLKEGLRQRVGYFGNNNGIYLEANGMNVSLVKRTYVTGQVVNEVVTRDNWNYDKFDGTGVSAQSVTEPQFYQLDLTKGNIFWIDIEWLGVGDVRAGFVVDNKLGLAHRFENANRNSTTYMQTACLPIRYEIENVEQTESISTMKQICSSVMSEGGYQGRNKSRAISLDLGSLKNVATANTFYPIISIKMADGRTDSIVVPKTIDLVAITNQVATLQYKVVLNSTLVNASFTTTESTNVVYDRHANTSSSGGTLLKSGYLSTSQKGGAIEFGSLEDFELQLGRKIDGTSEILTIYVASETSANVGAVIEWYELV